MNPSGARHIDQGGSTHHPGQYQRGKKGPITLIRYDSGREGILSPQLIQYYARLPDVRCFCRVNTIFVPGPGEDGTSATAPPGPAQPEDYAFLVAGAAGCKLCAYERVKVGEPGYDNRSREVEAILGTKAVPASLPGDTWGWSVEGETAAEEWWFRLTARNGIATAGRWVAELEICARTMMSDVEWQRCFERAKIHKISGVDAMLDFEGPL